MSNSLATGWLGAAVRRRMDRVVLAAGTALVLTMLAPDRTGELPWLTRALQFLAAAAVWEMAIAVSAAVVRRRTSEAWRSTSLEWFVIVIVASVPATAAMALVYRVAGLAIGPSTLFYAESLLLGLLVAFARRGLRQRSGGAARVGETRDRTVLDPSAGFLRRHAPMLAGSRLLALRAEDHYLRIHSDTGSALVLLRLKDAVAELGDEAGWQTHRSCWLAAGAGGQAARRGQAWQIVLDGGVVIPVSKGAVNAMRAAGYGTD